MRVDDKSDRKICRWTVISGAVCEPECRLGTTIVKQVPFKYCTFCGNPILPIPPDPRKGAA